MTLHTNGLGGQLVVLSFHHVAPVDQAQTVKLSSKGLYVLGHLTGPMDDISCAAFVSVNLTMLSLG